MKNILIIILLVISFFILVFAAYCVGFKIYFSSDRIVKKTQRLVKMTFQRDSEIAKADLSPLGNFSLSSFAMAQKGGFKTGTTFSVETVNSKVELAKLLKRELIFKPFEVSGIVLNLNYSGKRKFDYKSFFGNVKYIFYGKSAKHGLIRSAEINDISIINSNFNLKSDLGEMNFSNITLKIARLDFSDKISGTGSFEFSFDKIKTNAEFNFVYKAQDSVIEIQNFICKDFNVSADAKIKLNADGSVSTEYIARINKQKLLDALKDFPVYANIIQLAYPEVIDEIILIYPR
ncbi:MAG: hypothetical protein LBO62_03575 [Endomicrobium sp.]|jgi:hypothetical protein|nr:hypothetical protein [Endomicrobium sp.]